MIEITDRSDVQAVRCRETANGLEIAIVTEDGVYVFQDGGNLNETLRVAVDGYSKAPARLDDQRRASEPVESAD